MTNYTNFNSSSSDFLSLEVPSPRYQEEVHEAIDDDDNQLTSDTTEWTVLSDWSETETTNNIQYFKDEIELSPTKLNDEVRSLNKLNGSRLSGAGIKRYRFHRRKGHNPGRAYKMALNIRARMLINIHSPDVASHKLPKHLKMNSLRATQNQSMVAIPTNNNNKSMERSRSIEEDPCSSTSSILSNEDNNTKIIKLELGIINRYHPEYRLKKITMNLIQKTILNLFPEAAEQGISPRFNGLSFSNGWILINCLDEETAKWVIPLEKILTAVTNVPINIVNAVDVPSGKIFIGSFKVSSLEDDARILGYIQSQNEKIETNKWKILKNVPSESGTTSTLTLLVDFASMAELRKRKFLIFFKFGSVQLSQKKVVKN